MDILQIAGQLRPGTAWNHSEGVISQAIDGTTRVSVPTDKEIQDYITAHPEPIPISLEDRVAALELKVSKIPTVG